MKNLKSYIILAAMGATVCAYAQNKNLNQTVQVTNSYDNRLKAFDKEVEKVIVPDSLYRFDYNFDYTGFEKPYQGNRDFNPVYTDLEMAARPYDGKRVYLKAGAGYTLAPMLDFAATLKDRGTFKLGTHANFDSYFGKHRNILVNEDMLLPQGKEKWFGYRAKARAGFDARADFKGSSLQFSLDYEGAFGKSSLYNAPGAKPLGGRMYNGAAFQMGFDTHFSPESVFRLSFDLAYAFGQDRTDVSDPSMDVREHNADAKFLLGFRLGNAGALEVEVKGNYTLDEGALIPGGRHAFNAVVNPRYHFSRGRFQLGVGLGLGISGLKGEEVQPMSSPIAIWPTLSLNWGIVPGRFDLYMKADMNSYTYGSRRDAMELNYYIERPALSNVRDMDLNLGFKGNLAQMFDYNIGFGYNRLLDSPLFVVDASSCPSLVNQNLDDIYARMDIHGKFGAFSIDGGVKYNLYLNADKVGKDGLMPSVPPALLANLDLKYVILKRIGLGVGVDYRSSYRAGDYSTPFVLDLHAIADYRLSNSVSLFLKGENLLNRANQYVPLIARSGVCVTAGVVLNFN